MRVLLLLFLLAGVAQADAGRVARGYHKGRSVTIRLVPIDWVEVEVATARAFQRMRDAADKAGVSLSIRSGFRDHERQLQLYQAWRMGWGNRAARPGYSNHESGRALDIRLDLRTLDWLNDNAKRFGFRRTVRGEPWHWEYRAAWEPKSKKLRSARARR